MPGEKRKAILKNGFYIFLLNENYFNEAISASFIF